MRPNQTFVNMLRNIHVATASFAFATQSNLWGGPMNSIVYSPTRSRFLVTQHTDNSGNPVNRYEYGSTATSSWTRLSYGLLSETSYWTNPEWSASLGMFAVVSHRGSGSTYSNVVTSTTANVGSWTFRKRLDNGGALAWDGTNLSPRVKWCNDKFIVVGPGAPYYSTDGVTWTKATSPGHSGYGCGVAHSPSLGYYIEVSTSGDIHRSTDGISWTHIGSLTSLISDGKNYGGSDIAWCNDNVFTVSCADGRIAYSTDGVTWHGTYPQNNMISTSDTTCIYWIDILNKGIMFTGSGFMESEDGINWYEFSVPGITGFSYGFAWSDLLNYGVAINGRIPVQVTYIG